MAFIGGISAGRCSLLVAKEHQKTTSDFDALDPRERGCTPLSTPKKKSKRKNASRFAQRIFFASPIWSRCATDGTVKYILYLLRDSRRLTAAYAVDRYNPYP